MRRLVVCADGTWNRPDQQHTTNVVRMARLIRPVASDGTQQIVFYDEGVGTGNLLDRLTGGAFGHGLDRNIADAYRFIVNNYAEGDDIYLFGFSRGAYTVRSLGGLIRKCGVLHKRHADRFMDAYALYRRRDPTPDLPDAVEFRASFSRQVEIRFVGVWDTVGALGVPLRGLRWFSRGKYEFHNTELSRSVKFAYHAIGIDERRGPFKPTLWTNVPKANQTVEQTWFTGVHSDIGGGYRERGLADVTWRWMADKSRACGLELDTDHETEIAHPDPLDALHNSMTGFYRLTPGYTRPIGASSLGAEAVHRAAHQRHEDPRAVYAPANLVAYLGRRDARIVDS